MYPDTQSPPPSSPEDKSNESTGIHSSPTPRFSHTATASSAPDTGGKRRPRSINAILRNASSPFDRENLIVSPFDSEIRRDNEFNQKLKEKQVELLALMNSWVFSRLVAENERAGEMLARQMDAVAEAEREQEQMRLQLENCVANIKAALAVLSRAVM
ncbi:hypothetical protein BC834DRAFT_459736 [Gloeopeniophorella convolvens]|nr:hypothetical protein BC834DRAFT_459736 [Gloeopeniophorella convolvens]